MVVRWVAWWPGKGAQGRLQTSWSPGRAQRVAVLAVAVGGATAGHVRLLSGFVTFLGNLTNQSKKSDDKTTKTKIFSGPLSPSH